VIALVCPDSERYSIGPTGWPTNNRTCVRWLRAGAPTARKGLASAGGDSGSLILTNTSCAHPVALLFAGSSSTTIGNPIGDVLNALAGIGDPVSFVGRNCTGPSSPQSGAQSFQLPQQALDRASRTLEQNRHDLMSRPGVLGVGLGALEDNSQPAAVVYVDKTSQAKPQLSDRVDNVPVRIIMTDPFVAY
jgi:hypothetical protein